MELQERIVACRKCPRLVEWREAVAGQRRAAFREWSYWGRPVPDFGDPEADRLIVGLAPAAHGANRTGRMFTGDRSGEWLFRALHRAGVANSPYSRDREDGLRLDGVMITAAVHCAPPENKPTLGEFENCRPFLVERLGSRSWRSLLCLGSVAWRETHRVLRARAPGFGHGVSHRLVGGPLVVASYHPSQQNTFTGKLTEEMLDEAIRAFLETA